MKSSMIAHRAPSRARVFIRAPRLTYLPDQLAHIWFHEHRALFQEKGMAQRVITIVRYNFHDMDIRKFQQLVAQSYIEQGRVVGPLALVRNLGIVVLSAMRDVLKGTL